MSMSDPTAPVEGTPAPESTSDAPTGGTDLSPIMDRMEQLAGSMNEIQSGWQQFQQANAPEPEAETDYWSQVFGEQEPEPETQSPQLDPAALQSAIQQAIQQSNAPLLERLQRFEMAQGREQLYQQAGPPRAATASPRTQSTRSSAQGRRSCRRASAERPVIAASAR
jgi:hypothetical protein